MHHRVSVWAGETRSGIRFIILDLMVSQNLFMQHNYTLKTTHSHKEEKHSEKKKTQ